ncbi:uncharacterized protein im:7136021 isoform X2 [Clarias gariepinus]|uniref:uncharacterized protein im:7136021 isoform X2 n=1 Tax=Clarias gariepinus TaxID=13013 RepID=UPI00234DC67B|nr:uncharacterized protein im:7136021 isoform X2 [Clarias gariepinus]
MMEEFRLPEEVWLHVFQFLPTRDRLSVRSSCSLFMRLIDRPVFWKSSTLYIEKIRSFTSHSWRTLSSRKIGAVVVLRASEAEWRQLAVRLPWLHSVTARVCCVRALNALTEFKNLRSLSIQRGECPSLTPLSALRDLTHLSLCEVQCSPALNMINALSQLSYLTSLHYHACGKPIPTAAFHHLLKSLPRLQKLSLKMGSGQGPASEDALFRPQANHMPELQCRIPALTSLELLNYIDPILSPVALQGLPSLRLLTVQYRGWHLDPFLFHLKKWLTTVPLLSVLNISLGYRLGLYANLVPATVHHLSLKRVIADSKALRDLAQRVPDLLHLHLDLNSYKRQSFIAAVPHLFPKLESLVVRHNTVTVEEFLGLAQLSHLKHLVVLYPTTIQNAALMDLTEELRLQTNYRLNVIHSVGQKDPNVCLCVND